MLTSRIPGTRLRANVKKCEYCAKGLSTAPKGRKVEDGFKPLYFLNVFHIITHAKVVPWEVPYVERYEGAKFGMLD